VHRLCTCAFACCIYLIRENIKPCHVHVFTQCVCVNICVRSTYTCMYATMINPLYIHEYIHSVFACTSEHNLCAYMYVHIVKSHYVHVCTLRVCVYICVHSTYACSKYPLSNRVTYVFVFLVHMCTWCVCMYVYSHYMIFSNHTDNLYVCNAAAFEVMCVIQCVAACCSALQRVAACCSVLHCVAACA